MPGQVINISGGPQTITNTASVTYQSGKEALDLLGVSGTRFDFCLRGIFIAGTSPSATVKLWTSMYPDDNPNSWDDLWDFTAITGSNVMEVKSLSTEVLRYLRYSVAFSGTGTPSFTFELLGMAW
jgi:hypothetical protein